MRGDAINIADGPGWVRVSWRAFGGQLELKLLITVVVASPVICVLLLSMTQLGPAEVWFCVGVTMVVGSVIWLLVSGSTEVLLDSRGATRTVRNPLRIGSRATTPGPLDLRIAPLLGTSELPGAPPTQFMAVIMPVNAAFAPIENVVLTASDAARLKEALRRANVPGLTLQQDMKIEDETRPDCRVCGYDLIGSAASAKCPECGEPIDEGHRRSLARLFALRHGGAG